jgi:hypothetical protein
MAGRCPSCKVEATIVVETARARHPESEMTWPAVLFLCEACRTILSVSLDPNWQAEVVAGQLRMVSGEPGGAR